MQNQRIHPLGKELQLDLYACDPTTIRSEEKVRDYIFQVCDLINMKRYKEPQIHDFGEDPEVSGITFMQMIETSLVSGHLINQTNAACINIFSCSEFDGSKVAKFSQEYFGSTVSYDYRMSTRGKKE